MRAEFRLWHEGADLFYAMFDPADPKTPIRVDNFNIASERIQRAMPQLLELLRDSTSLRKKLFQVEFLSTLSGELLITLIYHRALDEDWDQSARPLAEQLEAKLIGRSRKQKRVLTTDYVDEQLSLDGGNFDYRQYEQGFTQPNAQVSISMLNWACQVAQGAGGDLLELYCGNGNFSLPLSRHFDRVLATEVAKSSMKAALYNASANQVDNLELVRLSAEEVCQAMDGVRQFRRLRDVTPIEDYQFSTVFVDPPRAGLDPLTEELVSRFDNIIYISCNPDSLHRNLQKISATHSLERLALFDQFPYTPHTECGVWLKKRRLADGTVI
jgi:tRNA (uracil-5-)-methyltransferase